MLVIVERLPSDKACPKFLCRCDGCGETVIRTGHRVVVERATTCRGCYLAQAATKRMQLVCVIAEATEQIGRAPTYGEIAARCVCSRTHIFSEVRKLQADGYVVLGKKVDPLTGTGANFPGVELTDAGRLVAARAIRA